MATPQEPYASSAAERAVASQGTYIAGINLTWLDIFKVRARVRDMADHLFHGGKPQFITKLLEVVVPETGFHEKLSGLQMLTPEGYTHAILAGIAQALLKESDNATRMQWKDVLLSTPVAFVQISPAEVWVRAWNNRQMLAQEHESLSRTAFQQAIEVVQLKHRFEQERGQKLPAGEVAQAIKDSGAVMAKGQDAITTSFVTQSQVIYDKLREPPVVQCIVELEELHGLRSCMNSQVKLAALASKPSPKARMWVVQALHDAVLRGVVLNEDVTKTALIGDKNSAGLISMWEMKLLARDHFLHVVLPRAGVAEHDCIAIRDAFLDHASYRAKCIGGEIAWQGRLALSSQEALAFLQDARAHATRDMRSTPSAPPSSPLFPPPAHPSLSDPLPPVSRRLLPI